MNHPFKKSRIQPIVGAKFSENDIFPVPCKLMFYVFKKTKRKQCFSPFRQKTAHLSNAPLKQFTYALKNEET